VFFSDGGAIFAMDMVALSDMWVCAQTARITPFILLLPHALDMDRVLEGKD